MIVKFQKADQSGWIFIDNIIKVRTNTTDFRIRVHSKEIEPLRYEVYYTHDGNLFDVNMVDYLELDLKGYQPGDGLYCALVSLTTGTPEHLTESFVLSNTQMYLLNDNGKTIEHL